MDKLHDVTSEQNFLSAIIDDKDYFIRLSDSHFSNPLRVAINNAISEIYSKSDTRYIDLPDLYDYMVDNTQFPPSEITQEVSQFGGGGGYYAALYADKLRDARRRRLLLQLSDKLAKAVYEDNAPEISRIKTSINEIERRTANSDIRPLSAQYLLQTEWPEPVWIVPGILPAGLAMLAGRPKAGKSWLSLQIAKAISHGGGILGQNVSQKRRVLYMALEDGPRRLSDRLKIQSWREVQNCKFIIADQFSAMGGLAGLPAMIPDYDLIIIDTFTRAIKADDQSDASDMKAVLDPIQSAAVENNMTVLIVDHMPKGRGRETEYTVIDDVFGSVAKTGVADTIIGLYRDSGENIATGVLAATGRDILDVRLSIAFDKGTWELCDDATRAAWGDYRHAILDCIVTQGDMSQSDIETETGLNKGSISRECDYLAGYGLIRNYKDGRRVMWQPTIAGKEILDAWIEAQSGAKRILTGKQANIPMGDN